MSETARRGKTSFVLVLAALILLGIPLGAWLLRGTIATSIAIDELAAQGIVCDERFEVEVGGLFGSATIVGPTRCALDGGIVEAVELLAPVEVELEGFEPVRVQADSARLVLRARDVRNGDRWAAPLRRLRLEQSVAGLVKGLSELGGLDVPPTTVGHLEVSRGGAVVATAAGVSLAPGAPSPVAADRILFPGLMGVGRLELTGVRGTASEPRVQLTGRASLSAGGLLAAFSTGGAFTLDASGLDTADPRFSLRL